MRMAPTYADAAGAGKPSAPFGGKRSAARKKTQPAMICKKTMAHQSSSTPCSTAASDEPTRYRRAEPRLPLSMPTKTWWHRAIKECRSRLVHDLMAAQRGGTWHNAAKHQFFVPGGKTLAKSPGRVAVEQYPKLRIRLRAHALVMEEHKPR